MCRALLPPERLPSRDRPGGGTGVTPGPQNTCSAVTKQQQQQQGVFPGRPTKKNLLLVAQPTSSIHDHFFSGLEGLTTFLATPFLGNQPPRAPNSDASGTGHSHSGPLPTCSNHRRARSQTSGDPRAPASGHTTQSYAVCLLLPRGKLSEALPRAFPRSLCLPRDPTPVSRGLGGIQTSRCTIVVYASYQR